MLTMVKLCGFSIIGATMDEIDLKVMRKMRRFNSFDFGDYQPSYSFELETDPETEIKSLNVSVYLKIDLEDVEERHCRLCEDMHHSFFLSTRVNCDACEYSSFKKRLDEKLKGIKSYGKSVAQDQIEKKKKESK